MILFVLGCAPIIESYDKVPSDFEYATEAVGAELVFDSFLEPYGLGISDSKMIFTDAATGDLWQWAPDESEALLLESGLGRPTLLAASGSDVVIYDSEGLQLFYYDGSNIDVLAENIEDIGAIRIQENRCFVSLPTAAELRHFDLETGEDSTLLMDLPTPYGLAINGEQLWISTQADQAVWEYNISTGDIEQILSFSEVPYGLDDTDGLWIATRSTRWPYGGWIYKHDGSLSQVSDSPPEAKLILGTETGVIWSSKQSIAYMENEAATYETLGIQTAVGGMIVLDDMLYWTDRQNGRLYRSAF